MHLECLVCGNSNFKVDKLYSLDDSDYGATDSPVTIGTFKAKMKDNKYPYAHECLNCGYIMFFRRDVTKEE